MEKLFNYLTLCGLGLLYSSSANAPESLHYASTHAEIVITVDNPSVDFKWVDEMMAQKYAPSPPEQLSEPLPVRVVVDKSPKAHFSPKFFSPENLDGFGKLYERTISFIKKHEGYAGGKAYYCVAGYKTIGYGHVIRSNESFPQKISRREADILLRKDLNRCLSLAREHSENLDDHELLAVAHFIFAKGIGNYLKSNLKKMIDRGENPSQEFLRWCKYHTPDGKLVYSGYSRSIREWEVDMFNGEFNEPVKKNTDVKELLEKDPPSVDEEVVEPDIEINMDIETQAPEIASET